MDTTQLVLFGLAILVGGALVIAGILLALFPLEGVQEAIARLLGRRSQPRPSPLPKRTKSFVTAGGLFLAAVGLGVIVAFSVFLLGPPPPRGTVAQEQATRPSPTTETPATLVQLAPPVTQEPAPVTTQEPVEPPSPPLPTPPSAMVLVAQGRFLMGSNTLGRTRGPAPSHPVNHPEFYIHQYEVTNGDYELCVAADECDPPSSSSSITRPDYYGLPDYDPYPIVNVTYYQAQAYCEWIGGALPTEAQWEKAARGTEGWDYPWGNDPPSPGDANLAFPGTTRVDTHRVGAHTRDESPYRVFDMAGNVSEWTASWYVSYDGNPQPFDWEDVLLVVRGGNFNHDPTTTIFGRTYQRSSMEPLASDTAVGFRCVWSPTN